jgi:hypothetical protein
VKKHLLVLMTSPPDYLAVLPQVHTCLLSLLRANGIVLKWAKSYAQDIGFECSFVPNFNPSHKDNSSLASGETGSQPCYHLSQHSQRRTPILEHLLACRKDLVGNSFDQTCS